MIALPSKVLDCFRLLPVGANGPVPLTQEQVAQINTVLSGDAEDQSGTAHRSMLIGGSIPPVLPVKANHFLGHTARLVAQRGTGPGPLQRRQDHLIALLLED